MNDSFESMIGGLRQQLDEVKLRVSNTDPLFVKAHELLSWLSRLSRVSEIGDLHSKMRLQSEIAKLSHQTSKVVHEFRRLQVQEALHEAGLEGEEDESRLQSRTTPVVVESAPPEVATLTLVKSRVANYSFSRWMEKTHGVPVKYQASLEPTAVLKFREIFDALDSDNTGTVGIDEVSQALDLVGTQCDISKEAILDKFRLVDLDKSGEVDFREFITAMAAGWSSTKYLQLQDEKESDLEAIYFFEFCAHFSRLRSLQEASDTSKPAWARHQAFQRLFDIAMIAQSSTGPKASNGTRGLSDHAYHERRSRDVSRAKIAARRSRPPSTLSGNRRQQMVEAIVASCGEDVRCFSEVAPRPASHSSPSGSPLLCSRAPVSSSPPTRHPPSQGDQLLRGPRGRLVRPRLPSIMFGNDADEDEVIEQAKSPPCAEGCALAVHGAPHTQMGTVVEIGDGEHAGPSPPVQACSRQRTREGSRPKHRGRWCCNLTHPVSNSMNLRLKALHDVREARKGLVRHQSLYPPATTS